MKIEWPDTDQRRRILAVGTLLGVTLWTLSLHLTPSEKMARLNLLTTHPELRWLKGGSFFIFTVSTIVLVGDTAYQKLLPRFDNVTSKIDSAMKDPINWLILALMTYTLHVSVSLPNLFVIFYLTAYQVTRS